MSLELNATLREDQGKGASRRLRHAKQLPAIVYGGKSDPVQIALLQKDVQHKLPNESFYSQVLSLKIDGKAEEVLVRDIQHHPYKMEVMHMDFIRVDMNKPVHVHSQFHFVGEDVSPGVKTEDGVVSHVLIEVERREDQHPRVGVAVVDGARRVDAVERPRRRSPPSCGRR